MARLAYSFYGVDIRSLLVRDDVLLYSYISAGPEAITESELGGDGSDTGRCSSVLDLYELVKAWLG